MYKQRRRNAHRHTLLSTNRGYAVAPGGASYRLPEVRDGCSAHFGRKCCRCGFGSCEEWRRWSSSVPLGTDVVFCFSWVDNMKQYIVISGYCIIDNMTFQPSALVWLPVVRLPRYFAPGCLSPLTAAPSTSLFTNVHLGLLSGLRWRFILY